MHSQQNIKKYAKSFTLKGQETTGCRVNSDSAGMGSGIFWYCSWTWTFRGNMLSPTSGFEGICGVWIHADVVGMRVLFDYEAGCIERDQSAKPNSVTVSHTKLQCDDTR